LDFASQGIEKFRVDIFSRFEGISAKMQLTIIHRMDLFRESQISRGLTFANWWFCMFSRYKLSRKRQKFAKARNL